VDVDRIVGTNVAGYSVESVLGRGAMGVVYVARQRSPERRVALKLIAPSFAGDESFRRRFLHEVVAAAAIEHPHILPVYDAGESDGVLFMAMRLVDGPDLRGILRTPGVLTFDRVMTIVGQIGGALDAAHARRLVHRDVKPGNVLVTTRPDAEEDDVSYLTDFGVSIWTTSDATTLATTGRLVGTADYVAPEQIEATNVDGRADLYSLGCVAYECLTGRVPFAAPSPVAVLHAHLHDRAPPPSSIRPDLPPAVDVVMDRALRKAPEERYASCRELTHELRAALSGSTGRARTLLQTPTPSASRSRSRGRAAVIGGMIVATVLLAAAAARLAFPGPTRGGPSTSSSPAARPTLIRDGVQVTASDTAPSSTDAAGDPVNYLPGNVIDGDVETAWRMPGNGHGGRITLLFDDPVEVVRIGLIPGYAKTDPQTGADRFFQDRIITSVRYLVPGRPPTTQTFRPVPIPQSVRLRATTSRIEVRILDTTEPGGLDYTAISEIYVYGYRE
jgi:serine/threonine protein kinase